MASKTMAVALVEAAASLLELQPDSSAFRRRAVSTAYYAVFHALAKLCADFVTRSARRSTPEYERAYRALAHGTLKVAFAPTGVLMADDRIRKIGNTAVQLQIEREKADYLPPFPRVFSLSDAQDLVAPSREAVSAIEGLRPPDESVRLLAVTLLFKDRRP